MNKHVVGGGPNREHSRDVYIVRPPLLKNCGQALKTEN